jgi:hypothetical protein
MVLFAVEEGGDESGNEDNGDGDGFEGGWAGSPQPVSIGAFGIG